MKNKFLPHLAARVFDTPLAVNPQKLAIILHAIGPRLGLENLAVQVEGLPVVAMPMDEDGEMEAKPYSVTEDGIAVIGISGTLVKKAGWLDAESGMQSYDSISSQFRDAVADPRIGGILLDVDSPGGEVGGLFDLADAIYAARATKPVYAVANDEAFSAAYALASSAEKLFITRTGGVGSIGVIAVHLDISGFDEKVGRKYTAVYAGARKNDFSSHAPFSDQARASLQGEIDRLYEMFVGEVARNRDLKPNMVRNTEASLFWGANGVQVGLADAMGGVQEALDALRGAIISRMQARGAVLAAATQIPEGEEVTMAKQNETAAGTPQPETKQPAQEPAQVAAPAQPAPAAQEPAPETAAQPAPEPEPAAKPASVDPAAMRAQVEQELRTEMEEISALCTLAGKPGFVAEAISKKMSAAQVREALLATRAQETERTAVGNTVNASPTGAESALTQQAQSLAASRNIPFAQAYVECLKLNPTLYQQYLAEKTAVKPN